MTGPSSHRRTAIKLTHDGALAILEAAKTRALTLGVAVNIVIVDEGGNDIAFLRMDGGRLLSIPTARAKARTAASHRCASADLDPLLGPKLAAASGGQVTDMAGGLPIRIDGEFVGGIGVGSGSDEEDVEIAAAGLGAVGANWP